MPPTVPDELAALNEALSLLGSRVKYELKAKPRARLVELLGAYPTSPTADFWKRELKKLRDELFIAQGSK